MKAQTIKSIRRRFRRQWLLIKINRIDQATTVPISGYLIAHSPDRDEIYKKSLHYKGLALIDYSEDKLPKGYAVAF